MIVKIDNLKELSKSIPLTLSKQVNIKNENMNIKIVKKYFFISLKSKFILVNINLFIKTFLGLLNERIWFKEYLNNEYILINLKPELVEKKEPPIITKTKYIKLKSGSTNLREKPIFDMLLDNDKKLIEKLVLKPKRRKKNAITVTK